MSREREREKREKKGEGGGGVNRSDFEGFGKKGRGLEEDGIGEGWDG